MIYKSDHSRQKYSFLHEPTPLLQYKAKTNQGPPQTVFLHKSHLNRLLDAVDRTIVFVWPSTVDYHSQERHRPDGEDRLQRPYLCYQKRRALNL